jgi:hypothetical protein
MRRFCRFVIKSVPFALLLSLTGNIMQYEQLNMQTEEFESTKQQLDKAKHAEIYLEYESARIDELPTLRIFNIGDRDADSIWLSQTYFLVSDSDEVFECDLPRFCYIAFDGSRRAMFNIASGKDTSIHFSPACYSTAVQRLLRRRSGQLVAQWTLAFSQHGKVERQIYNQLFALVDNHANAPVSIKEFPGGGRLENAIIDYQMHSAPQILTFVNELQDYYLNPPNEFYYDSKGKLKLAYSTTKLPKGQRVDFNLPFDRYHVDGNGFLAIEWSCESGDSLMRLLTGKLSRIY